MRLMLGCPECQRLWREYSGATANHIALESQLGVAALAHDEGSGSVLAPDEMAGK